MKLLLIGAGKWGVNYITALKKISTIELIVANRNNWKELIETQPNGVMIVTPPDSHIPIAIHSLQNHIPTMIEKPLSLSHQEAEKLLSFQNYAPILINHIHLFSDHFIALQQRCLSSTITHISSMGGGNGPKRSYSALLDYGAHDISMILTLFQEYPIHIQATREYSRLTGEVFDIILYFSKGQASITLCNDLMKKTRYMQVKCDNHTMIYDDYDANKLFYNHKPLNILSTPPLTNALQCFISLIQGNNDKRAGLNLSLQVMKVLDECGKQIENGDNR